MYIMNGGQIVRGKLFCFKQVMQERNAVVGAGVAGACGVRFFKFSAICAVKNLDHAVKSKK